MDERALQVRMDMIYQLIQDTAAEFDISEMELIDLLETRRTKKNG